MAMKMAKLAQTRNTTAAQDNTKNWIRGEAYGEKYGVIETIRAVQTDFSDNSLGLEEITKRYPEFVRDYAIIANLATSRPFTADDYNNIKLMMDKRKEFWDGKCTSEDAHAEISMVGAARFQPSLLKKKFKNGDIIKNRIVKKDT